jgi:hypothetical protein
LRLGCGSCRDLPRSARHDPQIPEKSEPYNTRAQFNKIIRTESYQALVKKLRAKDSEPAASTR